MAADLEEIRSLIAAALPGADVEIVDEGGGDHLRAIVAAPQFAGRSRIDQHRMVKSAVQHRMDDGSIHALSINSSVL
jgi:stress-induced morphogen